MTVQLAGIQHDGGTHEVSVETEGDQCVIKFGGSFTLRVDETNLNKLREMIHNASRDLTIERRDTTGVCAAKAWAWESSDQEVNAENEMVQAGICAREQLKAQRCSERSDQQKVDVWDPNDPANW